DGARLSGGTAAELHEVGGAEARDQLLRDFGQETRLRPGRVVLLRLADPIEEDGARLVVEVLGGEPLGGCRETLPHVAREGGRTTGEDLDDESGRGFLKSHTRLPEIIRRRCAKDEPPPGRTWHARAPS